jgi:Chain length determinant protein/G-rich domain on putative tyrosine kinase
MRRGARRSQADGVRDLLCGGADMLEFSDRGTVRNSIALSDLFVPIWDRRILVAASAVVLGAVLALVGFNMTPIYRVSTVFVAVTPDKAGVGGSLASALSSFGGLASLAGISVGSPSAPVDEAVAVLRSREFTDRFIRERALAPKLFADRWDSTAGRWAVPPEKQPSPGAAFHLFDQNVRMISQDKRTGLLTLQIEWRDRTDAVDWANDLIKRLNAEMRARAIANADASLGFLRKELDNTSIVESREAINRLIEAQINRRMIATVTEEYSFRVVDRAVSPDPGETVRPKKLLMTIFGTLLGLMLGIAAALFLGPRRKLTG